MNFEAERKVIEEHFKTQWQAGPYPVVPVVSQNEPFDLPLNATPWMLISILPSTAGFASLGPQPIARYDGFAQLDVYTEVGKGTGEANRLSDEASRILTNLTLVDVDAGTLVFDVTEKTPLGEDIGWWRTTLSTGYERDTIAP
jgi:hypothetical protein